jgi:superfamily II DNA/RNA helicase
MQHEVNQFHNQPTLIIGTPGRLIDHISRQTPGLKPFQHFIIDEYDKCVDMGFQDQLEKIIEFHEEIKSIQLSSATEAEELPGFLKLFPFEFVNYNAVKLKITYHQLECSEEEKLHQTALLLNTLQKEKTIVFLNHREAANRLSAHLDEYGIKNVVYHGAVEQDDRLKNLFLFQSGCCSILICTDLASRGLDIPEVKHVVHYQFPKDKSEFIHRNGRTARNLHDGEVFIIKTDADSFDDGKSFKNYSPYKFPSDFEHVKTDLNECFWVGLGKFQKIRKIDFVGFLTQSIQIENKDIQGILIFPRYSMVSLTKKGAEKIKKLNTSKITVKKQKTTIKKFTF